MDSNSSQGTQSTGEASGGGVLIPDLIRRLDAQIPKPGAAPPAPPLVDINVVGISSGLRYGTVALLAAALGSGLTLLLS